LVEKLAVLSILGRRNWIEKRHSSLVAAEQWRIPVRRRTEPPAGGQPDGCMEAHPIFKRSRISD
jgi:hypothetical protein